jgi:tetratricopeptide (TPR) repeat protein
MHASFRLRMSRIAPATMRRAVLPPRGATIARQAVPFLETASTVDVDNAKIYYWLAHCHNLAGEYQAAGDSATKGLARKQRADLFVERAISLSARLLYDRSMEDADRALRLDAGNARALEIKGDVLMRQGTIPRRSTTSLLLSIADRPRTTASNWRRPTARTARRPTPLRSKPSAAHCPAEGRTLRTIFV